MKLQPFLKVVKARNSLYAKGPETPHKPGKSIFHNRDAAQGDPARKGVEVKIQHISSPPTSAGTMQVRRRRQCPRFLLRQGTHYTLGPDSLRSAPAPGRTSALTRLGCPAPKQFATIPDIPPKPGELKTELLGLKEREHIKHEPQISQQ
uniref:uncharacterized protein C12orf73 homolog isoform X1 n=1 Tax=Urocitellus parryii TaxID=9999 RepID=UPI000E55A60B|nr:uncharacterized protein C12orf73 homolog isoform X1 [Urocitellus parryii]